MMLMSGGARTSPFTIGFYGESSQGKTTIGDLAIDALLTSMNMSLDKKFRSVIRPGSKYWDTWKTSTTVGIMDDVGNAKSDQTDANPIDTLLLLNNNQITYAPKAEIEGKGKTLVKPLLVLINGHHKDLDATDWSICPFSGARRVDFSMEVRAKAKFQSVDSSGRPNGLDSDKVRAHYTVDGIYSKPPIEDLWDITVFKAVRPLKMNLAAKYEVVVWNQLLSQCLTQLLTSTLHTTWMLKITTTKSLVRTL
jgi:hypothetical protein